MTVSTSAWLSRLAPVRRVESWVSEPARSGTPPAPDPRRPTAPSPPVRARDAAGPPRTRRAGTARHAALVRGEAVRVLLVLAGLEPLCVQHDHALDLAAEVEHAVSGPPGGNGGHTARDRAGGHGNGARRRVRQHLRGRQAQRFRSRCADIGRLQRSRSDGGAGLVGQRRRSVSSSSSWRWLTASVRSRRLLAAM